MEMLQNTYAIISLLFGSSLPLAASLKTWIIHVTSNKATYMTHHATKPSYLECHVSRPPIFQFHDQCNFRVSTIQMTKLENERLLEILSWD